MGIQRNMSQIKEQEKSLEKELNKIDTSNLKNTEFKSMLIRMLKKCENFNIIEKIETIKTVRN